MGEQASKQLEIRKYPNRRYYDSTRSQHVTLEEIHSLIREGYEVRVTDSKTGQDITQKVLAQIIVELDPPKLEIFPVPLLHRLIRSNEQIVNDFVEKYFNQALNAFLNSQRDFEQTMRRAMGLSSAGGPMSEWARMLFNPLAAPYWGSAKGAEPPQPEAEPAAPAQPPTSEPEDLRQVIADLQRQVSELRGKRKPRGGRRKA